jgi:DNA-binding Lrp family transcriptional regulator
VALDSLDLAILRSLLQRPRVGVREHARTLGLARATVQSRLDRMEANGTLVSYEPEVSLAAIGYPVVAFMKIHLRQGTLDNVSERIATLPFVIEAYSTTGDADLICKVVARDHSGLEAAIQDIVAIDGVMRTHSDIALRERVTKRVLPLIELACDRVPDVRKTPGPRNSAG